MGIPTAQAAQPISQQQPAPQGKGGSSIPDYVEDAAGIQQRQKDLEANPAWQHERLLAQSSMARPEIQNQRPSSMDMNAPAGGFNGQPSMLQTTMESQRPQGKGFSQQVAAPEQQPQQPQQPQQQFGKGGTTNSATSGQPRMGRSNPYSNTIQPWDNSNNQTQTQSGKGKGH